MTIAVDWDVKQQNKQNSCRLLDLRALKAQTGSSLPSCQINLNKEFFL